MIVLHQCNTIKLVTEVEIMSLKISKGVYHGCIVTNVETSLSVFAVLQEIFSFIFDVPLTSTKASIKKGKSGM